MPIYLHFLLQTHHSTASWTCMESKRVYFSGQNKRELNSIQLDGKIKVAYSPDLQVFLKGPDYTYGL